MSATRPARGAVFLAAGLTLVLVLWFGRACFGGWWIVDTSPGADVYLVATIYERWAAQVADGRLPLWFGEFQGGFPVHAAWMYGLAYPPLALFLVLPPEAAWTWLTIVHVVFGALGVYRFLWDEREDATAAASGALVFALSAFVLGRPLCGHLNLVMPLAWAPWVLFAVRRTVRGVPGAAAGLGLCAGAGLVAGHVQVWFYVAPLVIAFALAEALRTKSLAASAPRLAFAAATAVGVSAVQWLPAAELVSVAGRPVVDAGQALRCSATAGDLVAQLAPRLAERGPFAHETTGLAGPLAVAAALLALRFLDPRRGFWSVVLLAGLVLATGATNVVGEFANELPPFRWARTPGRALLLVVLAGAVLSGHLVADWLGRGAARWRALVPVAFAASALVLGVAPPQVVRADFHDFDWTRRLPESARGRRVRLTSDVAYPCLERLGVGTLTKVCPVDTPGHAALLAAPVDVYSWWLDVGCDVEVPWRGPPADAQATALLASEASVVPRTGGGPTQVFERAETATDAEAFARLAAGERVLLLADEAAPAPGPWTLLSEKWYPGRVDAATGEPVRRANLGLAAVPRAPGADAVVLAYEPRWLAAAVVLGAAALAAAAVALARSRRGVRDSTASR